MKRLSHLTRIFLWPVLVALGVVLTSCSRGGSTTKPADVDYYTCTMHPSVRSQNPKDKCPICGMDLVPVKKKASAGPGTNASSDAHRFDAPTEFTVPVQRQQEIGVTYATVEKKPLLLAVRAAGLVAYDRLRHWDIVTRVEGYVDKLFVASKGELVEKDQPLVTIYSPELLTTQREFFDLLQARDEASRSASPVAAQNINPLIESAKVRMRLWNITDRQIEELERTRKPQTYVTIFAPTRGLVQNVQVDQGRKVMAGDHLVDVADLSLVWVWAEFYQEELPLLQKDLPVKITSSSYPGEEFKGKIQVIDPFLNETKRVVRVRIDVDNRELKLRPDMFVDVQLERDMGEGLTVPVSAVMPTGKRNIAFVDKGGGLLEPRLLELGRKYGDVYEVRNGLTNGERIVASGNFLIDAEAKVQGALKSW
jgi:Cu(I)/Ag(I) efflux system membrane fusion protein